MIQKYFPKIISWINVQKIKQPRLLSGYASKKADGSIL